MTVNGLLVLDLFVMVVAAAAWLGAGITAATRRPRWALALVGVGLVAAVARVVTVLVLARAGWWFVQEKVTLTVPLLVLGALVATLLAGRGLLAGGRVPGRSAVIALLGAGYAAAAGLVVTSLLGYPATAATAVLTLAGVAGAVLVTWRLTSPVPVPLLRIPATATVLAALVGVGLALIPAPAAIPSPAASSPAASSPAASSPAAVAIPVSDLVGPATPAPGGAVRRYTLTARTASITLASGSRVDAWTFNGQAPGPALTATEGDLLEVTLHNVDIDSGVTLHWHGYDVPNAEDGAPGATQDAVAPGHEYVYRFLAAQTGTYWYHTHEASDPAVAMGLYGTLVVGPREVPPTATGVDLTLPIHTLPGARTAIDTHDQPFDVSAPPGRPVRLRLINTDSLPHRLTLAGTPYRLAAVDGTDLHEPGELTRTSLRLPAGGRYDLTLVMPTSSVSLRVTAAEVALRLTPGGATAPANGENTSGWPDLDLLGYGTPTPTTVDTAAYNRQFTLVLDNGFTFAGGRPSYTYTVNGRSFPDIPVQTVHEGDLVRFTVVNRSQVTHPWHLHGHHVLVLSRDGRPVTGSPLWLDTFDVQPGETWVVAFRADNPGVWMNHCHNLAHTSLTLHLTYDTVAATFHGGHSG
jgi:FtsP/CotA-like multicopper oxidase with cupredoxin domain